jgi:hypothetical protein
VSADVSLSDCSTAAAFTVVWSGVSFDTKLSRSIIWRSRESMDVNIPHFACHQHKRRLTNAFCELLKGSPFQPWFILQGIVDA